MATRSSLLARGIDCLISRRFLRAENSILAAENSPRFNADHLQMFSPPPANIIMRMKSRLVKVRQPGRETVVEVEKPVCFQFRQKDVRGTPLRE